MAINKILTIKAEHDEAHNCIDDLIAAVAKFWNRDYELMFLDHWGFTYDKNDVNKKLGSKINPHISDPWMILEKYHGIKLLEIKKDTYLETITLIENYLKKENPIAIYIDNFWCPWDIKNYKKNHTSHYVLALSIDSNGIFCVDPQRAPNGAYMPLENYSNGWGDCVTFELKNNVEKIDINEIITNITSKLEHDFDSLFTFINDLSNVNFEEEMFENSHPLESLLVKQLITISNARKAFSKSLKLLSLKINNPEFINISQRMRLCGTMWESIWAILIKMYFSKNTDGVTEKIINVLNRVLKEEREILNSIQETQNSNCKKIKYVNDQQEDIDYVICSEFMYVNLDNYINNKGFGLYKDNKLEPKFSVGGAYFLKDNLPENEIWSVDEMRFRLPYFEKDKNDNIHCNGEIIDIKLNYYKKIMLLGNSELSNSIDIIYIYYTDGFIEEISIGFSNWISLHPEFNEKIAWKGKVVVKFNEETKIENIPVHLFAKEYQLKHNGEISAIKLPDYSNIHLFAITLGK